MFNNSQAQYSSSRLLATCLHQNLQNNQRIKNIQLIENVDNLKWLHNVLLNIPEKVIQTLHAFFNLNEFYKILYPGILLLVIYTQHNIN